MAIFNKNNKQIQESKATTIISQGAVIKGNLELNAKLHIEGIVEGNVSSINEISIGKEGVMKGDIKSPKLIVNGVFEGNAECDYIEIMKGGILKGDIVIKNLTIENGGCFSGTSNLKEENNISKKPQEEKKS